MEEIGRKCQTLFISLLSGRRRQTTSQMFGFPGGSAGKESPCNAGDPSSIPGLGRPPGGGNALQNLTKLKQQMFISSLSSI